MKILALIGSPRKDGNTDLLVEQILEAGRAKGHTGEKLYLYDYRISPCVDCRQCKKGELVCCIKDGMQQIYPKMETADLLVFGTPLYWYGPTAKMKLLIDRMRPYVANGLLKGKKGVVVAPAAEGAEACASMVEMFRLCFEYLGIEFVGKIFASAYDKGEVLECPEALERARELGASL